MLTVCELSGYSGRVSTPHHTETHTHTQIKEQSPSRWKMRIKRKSHTHTRRMETVDLVSTKTN